MGEADADGVGVLLRLVQDHGFQILQPFQDLADLLADVQAAVHLALVIAAAGGVELLAHITDPLNQAALDTHVDVLVIHVEYDLAGGDVLADVLQARHDGLCFLFGHDALLAQHGHMGDAAVDILVIHALVEENGGIVGLHHAVHFLFEPAAP